MDFKTIAQEMYPYWICGVFVISLVLAAGQKKLLRMERKPIIKWLFFLAGVTTWRYIMVKMLGLDHMTVPNQGIMVIPWQASLTVFWEDACHGLPLLILHNLLKDKQWWKRIVYYPALWLTMLVFGMGHLYQGLMAGVLLSLYIPYSIAMGRKYGFGTIIICHMLYDLVTMLFAKFMLGM